MRRRRVDLWYQSSFGRSRSVETSRNSSLSSQRSWLAAELGAQHGRSSLRYLTAFCLRPTWIWLYLRFSFYQFMDTNTNELSAAQRASPNIQAGAGAVVETKPGLFAQFRPVYTNRMHKTIRQGLIWDLSKICQVIITNMCRAFQRVCRRS